MGPTMLEPHLRHAAPSLQDLLLQNISDYALYLIAADGRIVQWTDAAQRIKGYSAEEVIGQSISIFYPPDTLAAGEWKRALQVARETGRFEDKGWRVRKGGERFWAHVVLDAVHDNDVIVGFAKTTRDITEQKQTQDALSASEARYRLLAESTTDLVLKIAANGIVEYASPGARILGYQPEDLIGRHRLDLIHPDDKAAAIEIVQKLMSGVDVSSIPRREYRFRRKDGGFEWLEGNPRLIRDENGAVSHVISAFRNVSSRRTLEDDLSEAKAQLQRVSDRYRRLAENANDLVSETTLDGKFSYVSPSVERITGYPVDEVLGRRAIDFVHPDDLDRVRLEVTAALTSADPVRIEHRHIRKDGRIIWIESRPRPAIDPSTGKIAYITDVMRDVTERKLAAVAQEQRTEMFRNIASNISDIIVLYSLSGEITYVSPSVKNAIGYQSNQIVGRNIRDLALPTESSTIWSRIENFLAAPYGAPAMINEFRIISADGSVVWLQGHANRRFDHLTGELLGVQSVVRVITDQKAIEAEITKARDAAVAADQAKSDFVSNMSHEIRTPLTAIIGYASLLQDQADLSSAARLHVDRLGTASRALMAIVNDVLDYSRIEASETQITPVPVNVRTLVEETLSMFSGQAAAKSLRLDFETHDPLPEPVMLDPDRFRQILMNLVGNALKFTEEGGVKVTVTHDAARERLDVAVTDTGAGLSEVQCAKLFQRFSQVDISTTRRHGGTGLGLAICKGLAEAMGGAIGVSSRVGQGSTFAFHVQAPMTDWIDSGGRHFDQGTGLEGLRVLVADDNTSIRHIAKTLLCALGMVVTEAIDGVRCLEALAEAPFDVVLLDNRMPGKSGVEVLQALRSGRGLNAGVPVIAFTADATSIADDLLVLFDGIVTKPICADSLACSIQSAVGWTAVTHRLTA